MRICVVAVLLLLPTLTSGEEVASRTELAQQYRDQVQPLLKRYCYECHGETLAEADLDLSTFSTLDQIAKKPRTWIKVREMLESGQMPPKDAPQPSASERPQLQSWVNIYLSAEARAHAGDPGKVVLRRLNNAEYTYTLRDLTGVAELNPAEQFPVDGAAGEGFTNTGNALAMSPALVAKYLDAAKDMAQHTVLLPEGIRFSPHTTRRDWTEDVLTKIRRFYADYTDARGGDKVNLQGVVFDTNEGGRLPLEKYFVATLQQRSQVEAGETTIAAIAAQHGLNAKYLGLLWKALHDDNASPIVRAIAEHWRDSKVDGAVALAEEVRAWQKSLWRFSAVGHIGKVGGPTAWMEATNPLIAKQDFRFKLPAASTEGEIGLTLQVFDAGDGNQNDVVVWQQPKLVSPGKPEVLLRDVRRLTQSLLAHRQEVLASTQKFLAAAAEVQATTTGADVNGIAGGHAVDPVALKAWLDYLGVGLPSAPLSGHFTDKITTSSSYEFIKGWGTDQTPLLIANSSDQAVRIPGRMRPHSVAVHPSPKLRAAIGWRSPVSGKVRVDAVVGHAHPECGNGVSWSLELRRADRRRRLAAGVAQGEQPVTVLAMHDVAVQSGDVISLSVGPRDGNHSCDLTAVDLKITANDAEKHVWDLAADVSGDILTANPHADRLGNKEVWNFYTEPDNAEASVVMEVPEQSLLARWLDSADRAEKQRLAESLQKLLLGPAPADPASGDAKLHKQLTSLGGPLFLPAMKAFSELPIANDDATANVAWGIDAGRFGKDLQGAAIDAASLCVAAPSTIEIKLPAEIFAGWELVSSGALHATTGSEGSVQLRVSEKPAADLKTLVPSEAKPPGTPGTWTDGQQPVAYESPVLTSEGSAKRKSLVATFDDFRSLFPAALCYTKIVPVDEVVTLNLFYREDQHLQRLMLNEQQTAELNALWRELHFVSQSAFTSVDAYAQLMEFATQDGDPKVFEPLRKPLQERAATFRQELLAAEPKQLSSVIAFADSAYRRPLRDSESQELRQLYATLRAEEQTHDDAIRLTIARVLVAPAFLYRLEQPGPGVAAGPVSDWELANRLSCFLWSSAPDEQLRAAAAAGKLHEPAELKSQMARMLADPKIRRLSTEFGCQWLHIYDFDKHDEKSEQAFPTFAGLRGAMYEESVQFLTYMVRENRPLSDLLAADYTFVNDPLAKHYALPANAGTVVLATNSAAGAEVWRRVENAQRFGRGGVLTQATVLATQSGASRTSPILRGNWVSEILLGERLPRPPKGVPPLPEDGGASVGLTVRQLVQQHTSDEKCSICHARIDPLGFSLEHYDAIGAWREKDTGELPFDTKVTTIDGAKFDGIDGLRSYLLKDRGQTFERQFCRKLLGYALGRSVQLSDEPLLDQMRANLAANEGRIQAAIETIVQSRQFLDIRGQAYVDDEE